MQTQKIKWKYVGTDIYFFSSPEDFEKQKEQNRRLAGVNPETKTKIITYEHRTDNNDGGCRNCGGGTKTKSGLSMEPKETGLTKPEADGLPDLPSILDSLIDTKTSDWGYVS
jgi:hypothetical protein